MNAEEKLAALGLVLPPPPRPVGSYRTCVRVGPLLYLAGHVPLRPDKTILEGVVGGDLTLEQGIEAAKTCALALLATVRQELGSLNRIQRVIKVLGFVNCPAGFRDHPKVLNGATDLFAELWGEAGRGARSAVGASSLPLHVPVEVEAILEADGEK